MTTRLSALLFCFSFISFSFIVGDIGIIRAQNRQVEVQPLAANVKRLVSTLQNIGYPVGPEQLGKIHQAIEQADSQHLQAVLDKMIDLEVAVSDFDTPVTFKQIRSGIKLYQNEYRPLIVKVINGPRKEFQLLAESDHSGAVYSGTALFSLQRQKQSELGKKTKRVESQRHLFGLGLLSTFATQANVKRLASRIHAPASALRSTRKTESRDLVSDQQGQRKKVDNKDNRRKAQRLALDVAKAIPVKLEIIDETQKAIHPIARLEIRDRLGRIYPNQPKRLAPDFFFQPHIYRRNGEQLFLTPGEYRVRFCRGPEYQLLEKTLQVFKDKKNTWRFELKRWIQPELKGYYSGDHHIHAAGCAHYTAPTQGVTPEHMYRQVTGEGLNVGCVLTWGPCFDFQRQYFSPDTQSFDNRETLLKYDIEVSGFGSQALGHVCLLNLKDQTYPNSEGTKIKGWPTWTTPVMRWAKKQGGYTGYAHSASGLAIDPRNAARRIFAAADGDKNES